MDTKIVEHEEQIAIRVPPGDRWNLLSDGNRVIYNSLIEVLEAYHMDTKFKGSYKLSPLEGKIFAIKQVEEEIKPEPVKQYNIYGDPI